MQTWKQQSEEIEQRARLFSKSWLMRLTCRLERWVRYRKNEPLHFRWTIQEGVVVGNPIEVTHEAGDADREYALDCEMTDLILLNGMKVNAIQHLHTTVLDRTLAITTFQPRWIED